jgi:hypothetical protein
MKRSFFLFCLVSFVCILSLPVFAQIGPPPPDPQQPVPITGIELLIGAGAALGVKKIMDSRKRS